MSQGLPIISTPNVNAAKHLIKDGKNGYIVPSISSKEFNEALSKIIDDDTFNYCINEAKQNTLELMAKVHNDIFKEIMK